MQLIFKPYLAVGPIGLGMSRPEVRTKLREKISGEDLAIEESQFGDYFSLIDISVDYKRTHPYGCHIIGIYPPNNLFLEDQDLMNLSLWEIKRLLEKRRENFEIYTEGIAVSSLGLLFDTEDYEELKMESPVKITVFDKTHDLSGCLGQPNYRSVKH